MGIYAHIGGYYRRQSSILANISGSMKELQYVYANIDGANKQIHPAVSVPYTQYRWTTYMLQLASDGDSQYAPYIEDMGSGTTTMCLYNDSNASPASYYTLSGTGVSLSGVTEDSTWCRVNLLDSSYKQFKRDDDLSSLSGRYVWAYGTNRFGYESVSYSNDNQTMLYQISSITFSHSEYEEDEWSGAYNYWYYYTINYSHRWVFRARYKSEYRWDIYSDPNTGAYQVASKDRNAYPDSTLDTSSYYYYEGQAPTDIIYVYNGQFTDYTYI